MTSATKTLTAEYKRLQMEPMEGFRVSLKNDDLFQWEVGIFGAPETIYEGAYFKAIMRFPHDYPYAPPTLKFLSKVWHPNVYENGDLCISILHHPVDDPHSGELACERWNPTQSVRTILLSVISLLSEPNISSPANVDASVMYRKWKNGQDNEYETIVRKQVKDSKLEAEKDGVVVPMTIEEYCIKPKCPMMDKEEFIVDYLESDDIVETDWSDEDDDNDDDDGSNDSGHEES